MEFEIRLERCVKQLATVHIKAATADEAKDRALRLAAQEALTFEFWGEVTRRPRVMECSQIG